MNEPAENFLAMIQAEVFSMIEKEEKLSGIMREWLGNFDESAYAESITPTSPKDFCATLHRWIKTRHDTNESLKQLRTKIAQVEYRISQQHPGAG